MYKQVKSFSDEEWKLICKYSNGSDDSCDAIGVGSHGKIVVKYIDHERDIPKTMSPGYMSLRTWILSICDIISPQSIQHYKHIDSFRCIIESLCGQYIELEDKVLYTLDNKECKEVKLEDLRDECLHILKQ